MEKAGTVEVSLADKKMTLLQIYHHDYVLTLDEIQGWRGN